MNFKEIEISKLKKLGSITLKKAVYIEKKSGLPGKFTKINVKVPLWKSAKKH